MFRINMLFKKWFIFLMFIKYEQHRVKNKVSEHRRGLCKLCSQSSVVHTSVNVK